MPGRLSRDELVVLVKRIMDSDGTEAEIDEWERLVRGSVPHPEVSGLIFHSVEMSAEAIVDAALAYEPVSLPSKAEETTQAILGKQSARGRGPRFFVRHLPLDDPRRQKGQSLQIQLVDQYGRAMAFTYISDTDSEADVGGQPVPPRVIATVRGFPAGSSDFVDENGTRLAPKDLLD